MTAVKPPFAYYGGKTTIGHKIAAMFPEHRHYVEPFCGSLAVLLSKPPSMMETVNDLDGDLMLFWRMLRDRPEDLVRVCELTPHGRAEHLAARDYDDAPDDLERARRVWVLLSQGRTGTLRKTGWRFYSDPSRSSIGMPAYLRAYLDRMLEVTTRLRQVSLECRPALEVIAAYGQHRQVLLYCDPPYLGETRAVGYRHEMTSEDLHRELAAGLHLCRSAVVLSGYPSDLYDELYHGWDRVEIPAGTGQAAGGYEPRTEVLWSNRPLNHGRLEGIA